MEQIEPARERALLGCGVEVARTGEPEEWLGERAGHYSHVVVPQDVRQDRLEVLRKTQPGAAFVGGPELEDVFRTAT
jgi:hypothetical protein